MRSYPTIRRFARRAGVQRGVSVIEALLAIAVFAVLAAGTLIFVWEPLTSTGSAEERTQAMFLAQEGIDAARSIRNDGWSTLADGTYGIDRSGGTWALSGANDTDGIFTREVTIAPVTRDGVGDVVTTGGTVDPRIKKITSSVSWDSIFGGTKSLSYETYVTHWNVYDWTQTSDSHFNGGSFTQTDVQGTGTAASVILGGGTGPKDWIPSEGSLTSITDETFWVGGEFTDTVVAGSGGNAVVQATGDPEWIQIFAGESFFETTDIDFSDGTFSTAVVVDTGDLGAVSLDTAQSWALMASPATNHMSDAAFSSSIFGFAVGEGGSIIQWDGTSWTTVVSSTNKKFSDVALTSSSDGFAVGSNGTIVRWNGTSWLPESSPVGQAIEGVDCVSASLCFAVGSGGKILGWDGVSWTQFDDTGNNGWTAVDLVTATDGWAVSNGGDIIHWDGVSWTTAISPTGSALNDISCSSTTSCFAVGQGGTIIGWNGSVWSVVTSPTGSALYGVSMVSSSNGWAVGVGGTLLSWNGIVWNSASGPDATAMNGIQMVSANEGFAVGQGGTVWHFAQHFAPSGTYLSGVFDGGQVRDWARLFWIEDLPTGTDLTIATRSGPTAVPDGTWSAWGSEFTNPLDAPIDAPDDRYFQYRVTMTTSDQFVVPRLNSISITYDEPPSDTFLGVAVFPTNVDGFAVGVGGNISRFDGVNWVTTPSPTTDTLVDVDFFDASNVWAVGDGGTIIYWNGTSWTQQVSTTNNTLYDVEVISVTEVYAVGQKGAILKWDGVAWSQIPSGETKTLSSISMVSATDGWIVGANGTMLRWDGVAWNQYASPTSSPLNAIDMYDASFGVMVGQGGLVYHWDGVGWTLVLSTTPNELHGVSCIAIDDCWAVGVQQTFLQWDGAVWSRYIFNNPSNPLVQDVHMINNLDGWAVGESGAFYHYTSYIPTPAFYISPGVDSGSSGTTWNTVAWDSVEPAGTGITLETRTGDVWPPDGTWSDWSAPLTDQGGSTITSPPGRYIQFRVTFTTTDNTQTARLVEIRFIDGAATGQDLYACEGTDISDVWAVGRAGTITHYDGADWTTLTSPVTQDLFGVDALSASEAYAVGASGNLLRWEGTLWNTLTSPTTNDMNAISMASSAFGVAVGGGGTILYWDGVDWFPESSPTTEDLYAVHLLSATEGWAVGANGTIITWDGAVWSVVTSPVASSLNDVHLSNTSFGWAVGDGGVILNWDGVSWSQVTSPVVSRLNAVDARSVSDAWAMGEFGVVIQWDGLDWTSFTSPTTRDINGMTIEAPTDGWGCGERGTLMKDPPPYPSSGMFYSSVLDTDRTDSVFEMMYFNTLLPISTNATVAVRSGNTPVPDGTWSAFSPEVSDGSGAALSVPSARYFQYRVSLTTSNPGSTPEFEDITVTYRQ